jgi:dolichyl-phosphate-mannose--protein O-mannosyl transferase
LDHNATLIFAVASFGLAAVIIWQRQSIPPQLRRGLAITALVLVVFAFFLIAYALFTAGT